MAAKQVTTPEPSENAGGVWKRPVCLLLQLSKLLKRGVFNVCSSTYRSHRVVKYSNWGSKRSTRQAFASCHVAFHMETQKKNIWVVICDRTFERVRDTFLNVSAQVCRDLLPSSIASCKRGSRVVVRMAARTRQISWSSSRPSRAPRSLRALDVCI